MDIDRSDMIGFSLPPVTAPIPDPVHELHLKFVAERERVVSGTPRTGARKSQRVPAKWDEKEQQKLETSYWQRYDHDRGHGRRRRR